MKPTSLEEVIHRLTFGYPLSGHQRRLLVQRLIEQSSRINNLERELSKLRLELNSQRDVIQKLTDERYDA